MSLEQTWRWYGPNDPITLSDIRQAGATGIVTALHHISNGEVWELDAILERKKEVEDAGLTWSVIESIPVHEDIKQGKGKRDLYIERYKESLRNVGKAGIPCVCYNFMPVVDWTRTNLYHEMPSGGKALAFFQDEFAAFDLFVLKREGAENDYTEEEKQKAEAKFKELTDADIERLTRTIIAGLPGAEETYTIEQFREALNEYKHITPEVYRENIAYFLKEVIPVAEEAGVRMAVHADDPPRSIFGLPRVVSTAEDLRRMFEMAPSVYNGVTLCAGSFGVRADNDLPAMVEEFNERVHFVHLRSVSRTEAGDFIEDEHLAGDVDMYELMLSLLKEQKRRDDAGSDAPQIPMRPDHGHLLLDDVKRSNPGYTAIGRLKGLAELRGLEMGILRSGVLNK